MNAKKERKSDKCDKTLTKDDNGKESICQVCTMITRQKVPRKLIITRKPQSQNHLQLRSKKK